MESAFCAPKVVVVAITEQSRSRFRDEQYEFWAGHIFFSEMLPDIHMEMLRLQWHVVESASSSRKGQG